MKKQHSTVTTKSKLVSAKLQPLTPEFIRNLRGWLKGEPSALKILLQERRRRREL